MTKQWKKLGTIGAKAGRDLEDSGGNILDNDDVKNTSITLNASGYLNNIGTTEIFKNALIQANTDGSLNYAGSGSGNPTMNTITDASSIRSRILAGLTTAGVLDTTVPEGKGGTGLTSAGNTIVNSRIKVQADGTLKYDNTTTGAVTMNTLTDASNIRSRITTGLTSAGAVDVAVPVAKGGTNQTATNKFLNSDLGITLSGTTVTLTKAGDTNSTGDVPNALKNAQITTNNDGTLNNAGSGTAPNLANITGTTQVGSGGTGVTVNTTWLNANVTTFSVDKGNLIVWSNLNSNLTPSNTEFDWTITWYGGDGTSLLTTVIRANVADNDVSLDIMETISNAANATINLGGGGVTSGNIQTTTVAKNSVVCTLKAQIIDGSGWDFK